MIEIFESDIVTQHNLVVDAFKNDRSDVVMVSSFAQQAFPLLDEREKRSYPYEVRLPRSIPEMLKGDFTPSRIITVEKPIDGPYSNIWFGNAIDGVQLPCGYKNGDSRYINDVVLGDDTVHAIMAGATGQGKSVTLNAIIYGICMMYAPWEVHLTLVDAKIVEFKTIALSRPMPHIETVAATGDVDYLLSVIQTKVEEMRLMNSVFTAAGKVTGKEVKKLKDFREATGLMLPQNILVFDEFQTMFTNAGKLLPEVTKAIDKFARLGRNAGYHLFLASQELGTEFPKETLNNITVRVALGCMPAVSEMLLGNDGAAEYMGKKGRLIFNLNRSGAENKTDNSMVVVPLLQDADANKIAKSLISKGRDFAVIPVLKFYDEQSVLYENDYKKDVQERRASWHTIYLGEPSYVTDDPEQRVKLILDGMDVENICVLTATSTDQRRYFKMLKYNLLRDKEAAHFVSVINPIFGQPGLGVSELSDRFVMNENDYSTSEIIRLIRSNIYSRILCIKTDNLVFTDPVSGVNLDADFYSLFGKNGKYDTELFKCRFCRMLWLLRSDKFFQEGLAINASNEEDLKHCIKNTMICYETCNSMDTKISLNRMKPIFVWMLGLDRMLGLGRDSNSRIKNAFKKLLQDCTQANVRFITFLQTFEEFTDMVTTFRWYVLDGIPMREQQKIKCTEDYPVNVSKVLGVLYTPSGDNRGCVKFKKMFFDEEISV